MKIARRVTIWILIICFSLTLCSILFLVFEPEVLSAGWHLIHGSSAEFGIWKISVPWGYWEVRGKHGIVIQTAGRWTPRSNTDSDLVIENLEVPVGIDFDIGKWKTATIDNTDPHYQFESESTVKMEGETGTCLTYSEIRSSDRLLIHCAFAIHRLDFQYWGTKGRSGVLDIIARSIRPIS